ncbi:MAG: Pyrolysin precursor [Methanosaeta sp. PtaB.Bin039]|nr:MAG: Pyrolysin precursor [Methanosaeta sp. PtaB.Bin039]
MSTGEYILIISLVVTIIVSPSNAIGGGNPAIYNIYKGLENFGIEDAWDMGYTGKGVKIALMDSGLDFATPDLIGSQARIENVSSPYYGWPIVIDPDSLSAFQQDTPIYRSQYANTSSLDTKGYHVTGTSKSGIYHIGDHPDGHLAQFYGSPVKVLLVDEKTSGVYDTVYVDLNNNFDFRDDKPCRKGDEISYWDRDNDGYPDESGGMIYFIADGKTPLPFSKMLYGEKAKIPKNGELVAFHFDDWNHGTMCASIIVAQGKHVKGIAYDARIVPVRLFGANDKLLCLLASIGYDGIPNTGDEADIISRSGGIRNVFNKGVDEGSAFLEYLTTRVSPSTTLVYANGNDGSGYGTCNPPSGGRIINVGGTYDMWWNGSRHNGDIACFSSRGPNALGQIEPDVLATSDRTPEALPLWITHNGKASWDGFGGGTSGSTPHAAAVIALIYQAYKDAYGRFPTSEKARDILLSSATDLGEEVFAQGSGIINAKRAVEIASGKYGILVEPALLITSPIEAGSIARFNFTISDYSGEAIDLKPQILIKDMKKEVSLKPEDKGIFFTIPKELLDCDLLRISSYYERDAKNTKLEKEEGYDLYLYNWNDTNRDEKAQDEELEVIAGPFFEWGYGFTSEVRMHNPAKRMNDGIKAGLKARGEIKKKEIRVVIETYKWIPWNIELEQNGNQVYVSISTTNATGLYQGKISLESNAGIQCIPISFSTYINDEIKIKTTKEIYENNKIYGRFEGDGASGWDSRIYPLYHYGHDLATIEVSWEDPSTDIDVYLYGETVFDASNIWKYSTKPPIDLPKLGAFKENGHSLRLSGNVFVVQGDMVRGGPSYNAFYTSTGKQKEVIIGELTEGLNLILLRQVVSNGNTYGENITIRIYATPFSPTDRKATAGDIVNLNLTGVDGIIGFSTGEEIRNEHGAKTFKAKSGDVILIHSKEASYFPRIYFDSNENEKIDFNTDELIFGEQRYNDINQSYTDIIPIDKMGTYFLSGNCEFYHLKDRYKTSINESMTIKAPEQSGTYLGIAEKDTIPIPIPVTLLVEPGDPVSIGLKFDNITERNQSFQVELELQDRFGNLVEKAAEATIEFGGVSQKVRLVNGLGFINLTAPPSDGIYQIVTKSRYGVTETEIKIAEMAPRKTGDFNISSDMAAQVSDETPQMATKQPKETAELPEKVQSVSIKSTDGNISLSWPQSEGADRYNVYRLKYGNFEKAAEVNVTEYAMASEFWKSYTFRVSAVSSEGDEGEPSDPVAIVVTP